MRHRLKFIDLFAGLGDSLQYSKSYYRGGHVLLWAGGFKTGYPIFCVRESVLISIRCFWNKNYVAG